MTAKNLSAKWLATLSLAVVATGAALAHDPPRAGTAPEPGLIEKAEQAVKHGVSAAASGIERGAKATARGVKAAASGVERGAKAAARGVETGAKATANAVETAADKVGIEKSPSASSPAR